MSPDPVERRFADALQRARADWAAADPASCAVRAGCEMAAGGVLVPLFGRPHRVGHPGGEVEAFLPATAAEPDGQPVTEPAHVAVVILLLHHLLTADGAPLAGEWLAYRELDGGLFYAAAFAARAEEPIARAFAGPAGPSGPGPAAFTAAALRLGGEPLPLADAAFAFQALPRLAVAALLWAGDDEFPGTAAVLFDAAAGHYLPAEDLAGLGGHLAQRLTR
jgi:hypothetical protein